jgi:hypothetical protein
MTPEQFTDALASLEWKQSDLCRRLEVHKETPSRWATGKTPIPGMVAEYLRMALAIKALHRQFVEPLPMHQAEPVASGAP